MGRFHLYSLPDGATSIAYPPELSMTSKFVLPPGHSREGGKAEHPLDFEDLSAHALAYLAPTEAEIKGRGKADIIAKILVILQTSWFVAQCIARGVKDLPLTELEDKPKDVECPIRVYRASLSKAGGVESEDKSKWGSGGWGILERIFQYVLGAQDNYSRLSEESQVPMFWSGKPGNAIEARSMFGASILAMAFGAIHFIAWNSEFPSHIELLLWRISCIAMAAVPLTVAIYCGTREEYVANSAILILVLGLVVITLPLNPGTSSRELP